ncbi:hypothetical protein V8C42DRAFT_201489 [Trichoderma barbatum]
MVLSRTMKSFAKYLTRGKRGKRGKRGEHSELSERGNTTVAAAAELCRESFRQCILRSSSIHPRELSMVEDQVARFSTWTSSIAVFAPGRATIDHRLRYTPEMREIAIGLLESLNYRIETCSDFLDAHGKRLEVFVSGLPDEKLQRSIGDIGTEINHLNTMSNVIRRAGKETHILKAKDFQIKDEEGNDIELLLLNFYKRYIGDRFPKISVIIQQRLAETMIIRRRRILYRRFRHDTAIKLPIITPQVPITFPENEQMVSSAQSNLRQKGSENVKKTVPMVSPSQVRSATTLQPEKIKTTASRPSVVSITATAALTNHEALNFPTPPGFYIKQKYEKLKAERLAAHQAITDKLDELSSGKDAVLDADTVERIAQDRTSAEEKLQDALKSDLVAIGEITCPYCLYALPAEQLFDNRKWQNHVKHDSDPYVCLFEVCNEPDKLYNHGENWLRHMRQHCQHWRCPSHRKMFTTCEEYLEHMREIHNNKLSDSKLRTLAKRSARSVSNMFSSCPLCGKDAIPAGGRLEDHITGHLRSLALMSLPICIEDVPDGVGSESDSPVGSQPGSRSAVDLLDDEGIHELELMRQEDPDTRGGTLDLNSSSLNIWNSELNDDSMIQRFMKDISISDSTRTTDDKANTTPNLPADQDADNLSEF